jgi:hypothetical protein
LREAQRLLAEGADKPFSICIFWIDSEVVDDAITPIQDAPTARALKVIADESQYGRMLQMIQGTTAGTET